jgi:HSP20 family protein
MTDFGPYLEFVRIQTEMNKLFENLQELREPIAGAESTGTGWVPNVDVCECADELVVEAEMPGVDPKSLLIQIGDGNLTLAGTKPRTSEPSGATVHRKDRTFGAFRRVIPLSTAINTHKAVARLEKGILSIRFPRVPNKRGEAVTIPVQQGEE